MTVTRNYTKQVDITHGSNNGVILSNGSIQLDNKQFNTTHYSETFDDSSILKNHFISDIGTESGAARSSWSIDTIKQSLIGKDGNNGLLLFNGSLDNRFNGVLSSDFDIEIVTSYVNCGGIVARVKDSNNLYLLSIQGSLNNTPIANGLEFYKKVGGTWTQIATTTAALVVGNSYTIRFKITGNLLQAYVDGVLMLSVTDSSVTGQGKCGFRNSGSGNIFIIDSFNFYHVIETKDKFDKYGEWESNPIDLGKFFNKANKINTVAIKSKSKEIKLGMTANNAPSPYVASASTQYDTTNYMAWKAFCDLPMDNTNCWATANGAYTGWVQIDFGAGNEKAVNRYDIHVRYGGAVTNNPKSWNFLGSNDGTNWVTLDTQTNITDWKANVDIKEFNISNTTSYRYYRLNVTATNGTNMIVCLGRLVLYETIDLQYYTAFSDDGINFSDYSLVNADGTIQSPIQGRYVKIKAKLISGRKDVTALITDFSSDEQNLFDGIDQDVIINGGLKLTNDYNSSSNRETEYSDTGYLFVKKINMSNYKKINKIMI